MNKATRRIIFLYSAGPNRRRDTTPWEIRGDDIGTVIPSVRKQHD
jgi:hypothetical protein